MKIGQVRVDAQCPRVTEGLYGQNVVRLVLLIILRRIDPLLKIRVVIDPIWRVDVNLAMQPVLNLILLKGIILSFARLRPKVRLVAARPS